MTEKQSDNKSLYMYTSMIFIVAIVMIIVSFFAQTHLDSSMILQQDAEKVSLSNKAAQVSEENMQLVELNKNLRDKNHELMKKNDELQNEKNTLLKEISAYEILTEAQYMLERNKPDEAGELLGVLVFEELSEKQQEIYTALSKNMPQKKEN